MMCGVGITRLYLNHRQTKATPKKTLEMEEGHEHNNSFANETSVSNSSLPNDAQGISHSGLKRSL